MWFSSLISYPSNFIHQLFTALLRRLVHLQGNYQPFCKTCALSPYPCSVKSCMLLHVCCHFLSTALSFEQSFESLPKSTAYLGGGNLPVLLLPSQMLSPLCLRSFSTTRKSPSAFDIQDPWLHVTSLESQKESVGLQSRNNQKWKNMQLITQNVVEMVWVLNTKKIH